MDDIASVLVTLGAVILLQGLAVVRRLSRTLRTDDLRSRWHMMSAFICLFLGGYVSYLIAFWGTQAQLLDLLVPVIFFFGACFVWLTAQLSLQTAMDIIRLRELEEENLTDPLTGVYNRRHLDRRLAEDLAIAQRYALNLAVLVIDIDRFKAVNDHHGHQAGDLVLAATARRIASALRDADVCARYGGEEFVVIAPMADLPTALLLAERLRAQVSGIPVIVEEERPLQVTVSIGVAVRGQGCDGPEALLGAADRELYRAKRGGRNCVRPQAPKAQGDAAQGVRAPPAARTGGRASRSAVREL